MFTATLLTIVSTIFLLLSIYGALYLLIILRFSSIKATATEGNHIADLGVVTVLIPSFNEGPALSDTVETVLNQDYRGHIIIKVLIKDKSDTSYKNLRVYLPFKGLI